MSASTLGISRGHAVAYVGRIRNEAKKDYAERWLRYVFDDGPRPDRGAVSVMAAQAVQLAIGHRSR
jgi:hypothetical protein